MTNTHITIGGHKVSAGKVYSTSEVKTGDVWIDGKPIYRKVLTGTITTTDTTYTIDTIADIRIISFGGFIATSAGVRYPASFKQDGSSYSSALWQGTDGAIRHNIFGANFVNGEYTIIIDYIKTTD